MQNTFRGKKLNAKYYVYIIPYKPYFCKLGRVETQSMLRYPATLSPRQCYTAHRLSDECVLYFSPSNTFHESTPSSSDIARLNHSDIVRPLRASIDFSCRYSV
jgi:hypothetical protein